MAGRESPTIFWPADFTNGNNALRQCNSLGHCFGRRLWQTRQKRLNQRVRNREVRLMGPIHTKEVKPNTIERCRNTPFHIYGSVGVLLLDERFQAGP